MQPRERLLISAFAVLASGCAGASPESSALFSEYRAATEQRQRSREHTARALSAPQLSRAGLIRAVLDSNPSLEAARQSWRAALERTRQAGTHEDPMLMASLAPLSLASTVGYEVELSQRIPLGGKLGAQQALSNAEALAVQSEWAEQRFKLAQAASDLFDDYLLAVRSLEIQAQHIELLRALQQNLATAYSSGQVAVQSGLQAEAELARLEYQVVVFQTQRDTAIAQLNALLHRDPGAPLAPPAAEEALTDDTDEDSAEQLKRRPELAAARARLHAAEARRQVADAEYYPDLTFAASYSSMWAMPEHRFMAGVTVNLPLQRERREAAVGEATAMRAESESELQSVTDDVRASIAVARRQL
ncbi:MAG TPA: TolC family protein, partial [Polyangiales bacterium]|nr:TolC family protein [Polyangiales bacterium]